MSNISRALGALSLCLCLSFGGQAQTWTGESPTDPPTEPQPIEPTDDLGVPGSITTNFGNIGGNTDPMLQSDILTKYQTAGLDVVDETVFGDHVDIDTGALSFLHIDVSLPGNNNLPVQLGRSLSPMSASWAISSADSMGFDNWDVTIPHVRQKFLNHNGPQMDRCTGELGGPYETIKFGVATIYRWQFWDGIQLSLGGKPVGLMKGGDQNEFAGKGGRLVSKNGDIISCVPSIGPGLGEGFELTRRDGTTYEFGKRVEYNIPSAAGTGGSFSHQLEVFFVTRIEDVHGNYVTYNYSGNRLTSITSNDGRTITVTWSNGNISRVSANGRHWDYSYNADGLDQVTLPDGTYWDFSGTEAVTRDKTDQGCLEAYPDITVKHPAGAHATFEFDPVTNGRTNMPLFPTTNQPNVISECTVGHPESPKAFISTAVTKKTITVPSGPTQSWTWSYQQDNGAYQSETQPSSLKTRTVTYPDGHQVKTHINRRFSWEEGNVEKVETFAPGGALVRAQDFTYLLGHKIGSRMYAAAHSQSLAAQYQVYQTEAETTQDSATFTTTNEFETDPNSSDFAFGSPKKVIETTSTQPGLSRIAQYEYFNYKTPWILALPKKTTRNGKVFTENTYSSSLGLLSSTKTFGVTTSTYAYHSDGMLRSITDALGRVTEYTNYKRGTPQTEKAAKGSSAEATTNRTVDNNGWVTSYTNPRGNTFGISYDSMGRMTNFDNPGSWADTSVSFSSLGSGLVQTSTRGNSRVTTTYDGYYRPILVKSEDLTGHSPARFSKTSYDSMGRTSFSSWPSASSNPTAGVNTSYDALGRVTQTAETVTPFATTTTDYLSDNQVRVTDPVNAQTTTTYRAFGSPGTDEAMIVVDATGTTTAMTRDIHGNIENINQSSGLNGHTVNVDRKFWYDSRFRLCRHHAPELGDELFAYDNANQLTMSSRGEATGSGCGTPSSSIRTAFTYDAMGRQTLINFPSGTADISKTYDANSNVLTTSRGGINWTYAYNDLDLPTSEILAIDGYTYTIGHGYDTTGNVASRSYPGGLSVTFNSDGFGQQRQISTTGGSYVTNITYHPNGLPATAAYGNGKFFGQTITNRLQPLNILVTGAGGKVVDMDYQYDVRGKVSNITNYAVSGQNRSFTYDARGRLVTASGPWGSGSFEYDGLDNVRKKTLGSRIVEIQYNSANRVSLFKDTGVMNIWQSMSYDARGNVKDTGTLSLGGKDLVYDWANQPITLTGSGISNTYTYDGNLKRVKSVQDGKTTYWIYSAVTGTLVYADEVTDNIKTRYISGAGVQVRLKGGTPEYTHLDHQGSPITATDDVGNLEWREHYTPFGEKWQSDFANDNDIGYTGHVMDHASGLTYMQARYYDPVIGRFLSTDPIGYQDQMNLYAYVGNDPINHTDPSGEFLVQLGGALAGAAAEVIYQTVVEGKDLSEVDIGDVAVAGVAGATGLGAVKQINRVRKAVDRYSHAKKNVQRSERYLQNKVNQGSKKKIDNAQHHLSKAEKGVTREIQKAARDVGVAAGAIGGTKAAKELSPDVTPESVVDSLTSGSASDNEASQSKPLQVVVPRGCAGKTESCD